MIYLGLRDFGFFLIVFSGILVVFVGGMIVIVIMGIEMNMVVWIGFIVLFGIVIDDGVVMGNYI